MTMFSTYVAMQEFQAAVEGKLGAGRLEACAVRAVETVTCRVPIISAFRIGGLDLVDRRLRDVRILFAEVKQHRDAGLFPRVVVYPAAIVGDRGGDLEPRRREVRDGAAPAITHDADLAGGGDAIGGCLHVENRLIDLEGLHVAQTRRN